MTRNLTQKKKKRNSTKSRYDTAKSTPEQKEKAKAIP